MRRNLVPGLLLQLVALTLAVLYGCWQPFHAWLDAVGAAKQQIGYPYSAVSTALFGGFIPFVVLYATGRLATTQRLLQCAFYLGFWAWKGVEVDALYRLQAYVFGNVATASVIAKKTIVDQFLYNPIWAAPTQVWFFLWKDCEFSFTRLRQRLVEESFGQRVLVVLVSTWIVWIPAVAIVYALPTALQLPISNLVLCFWCLLLTSISQREG